MWRVAVRDLQWRRRRFLVTVVATSLIFSLTLLIEGTSKGIHGEAGHILKAIGGDRWLVAHGTPGPFTTTTAIQAGVADDVARLPGVRRADPISVLHTTMRTTRLRDINLIGYRIGGIGEPRIFKGREPRAPGEAVFDVQLGLRLGATVDLAGHELRVVGVARGVTFFFGLPTVFAPIEDTQRLLFQGLPIAMAVVTRGVPRAAPAGLDVLTVAQVRKDLERPLANGSQTIDFMRLLLWLVATGIIASIVYLSALERLRDFAVFKATGAPTRSLFAGLALQAVILSLSSAVIAIGLARLMAPGISFAVDLAASAAIRLTLISVVIGLLSSLAGLRRAVAVDPALAFGGA